MTTNSLNTFAALDDYSLRAVIKRMALARRQHGPSTADSTARLKALRAEARRRNLKHA